MPRSRGLEEALFASALEVAPELGDVEGGPFPRLVAVTSRGVVLDDRDDADWSVPGAPGDFRVRSQDPERAKFAGGHHLGRGPKTYRRSKTGTMMSDYPELDFRAIDNSGVDPRDVPSGTNDTGVFRCTRCGRRFEAIIANRVKARKHGRAGGDCARCTGWTPTPGNSLADLPRWLLAQLRLPGHADSSSLPIKGGPYRRYWWECPRGHRFLACVRSRLVAHARCATDEGHSCGCRACRELRAGEPADERFGGGDAVETRLQASLVAPERLEASQRAT